MTCKINSLTEELNELILTDLHKMISHTTNSLHINGLNELKSNIKNEYDKLSEPLNFILIGSICSGKTSYINNILSEYLVKNDNVKFELPASEAENTYYITFIEQSQDNSVQLTHCQYLNNTKNELKTIHGQYNKGIIDQINQYLVDLDDNSNERLLKFKNSYLNPGESINEIELAIEIIILKLPLTENIRIIDTPGLSSSLFSKAISYVMSEELLYSSFIYMKNLKEKEAIDIMKFQNIIKLSNELKCKSFNLCFTHIDELITLQHKNMKNYLKMNKIFMTEISDKINFSNVFVTNAKDNTKNSNNIKIFNKLKQEIEESSNIKRCAIYIKKLIELVKDYTYSQDDLIMFNLESSVETKTINTIIRSFLKDFPTDYDSLLKQYEEIALKIGKIILKNSKIVFTHKDDYISFQLKETYKIIEHWVNANLRDYIKTELLSKVNNQGDFITSYDNLNLMAYFTKEIENQITIPGWRNRFGEFTHKQGFNRFKAIVETHFDAFKSIVSWKKSSANNEISDIYYKNISKNDEIYNCSTIILDLLKNHCEIIRNTKFSQRTLDFLNDYDKIVMFNEKIKCPSNEISLDSKFENELKQNPLTNNDLQIFDILKEIK